MRDPKLTFHVRDEGVSTGSLSISPISGPYLVVLLPEDVGWGEGARADPVGYGRKWSVIYLSLLSLALTLLSLFQRM